MMKRLFAILLALAMLLSVSAVFAEGEETAAEPAAVSDTLLATVNGQEIRENNEKLQYYLTSALGGAEDADEETVHNARMEAMYYVTLEIMLSDKAAAGEPIDEEAVRQEAKEEWDNIIEEYTAMYGITEESSDEDKAAARADVLSYLESAGYTEEQYIQEIVENRPISKAYNEVLEELKAGQPDLVATEEDIQASYNDTVTEEMEYVGNDIATYEMYQNYYGYTFHYVPEGYRGITHILLSVDEELLNNWQDLSARYEESQAEDETEGTGDAEPTEAPEEPEEPVTAEMVEAARQAILDSQKDKIDEIKAKLEGGASFEDLIAEYGTDPGMQDEENLKNGYTVHPESIIYDTNFTNAAAALEKVGDVSDPVVSQFGIHIMHYLRDVPAGPLEISEEEKAELKAEIEDERLYLAFSEYYDQWLHASEITWTEEGEAWRFDTAAAEVEEAAAEETEETPAE